MERNQQVGLIPVKILMFDFQLKQATIPEQPVSMILRTDDVERIVLKALDIALERKNKLNLKYLHISFSN